MCLLKLNVWRKDTVVDCLHKYDDILDLCVALIIYKGVCDLNETCSEFMVKYRLALCELLVKTILCA